jgi:chemotaxis protein MotA
MDITTILGVVIGIGGILAGHLMEGGHFTSLLQLAAAVIVLGGTFGATAVANTREDMQMAFKYLRGVFLKSGFERQREVAREIAESAQLVRKESVLSLEKRLPQFSDPYMRNVFRFLVDGVDPVTLREVFENEMHLEETRKLRAAKVWSDAGGYAPTVGILGAVLGLIHVMANLSDTSALGQGIAVAFVATIYGVGSANLLFIPIANKIRRKIKEETEIKAMILEGAVSIVSGLNPYIIAEKMRSYTRGEDFSEAGS